MKSSVNELLLISQFNKTKLANIIFKSILSLEFMFFFLLKYCGVPAKVYIKITRSPMCHTTQELKIT